MTSIAAAAAIWGSWSISIPPILLFVFFPSQLARFFIGQTGFQSVDNTFTFQTNTINDVLLNVGATSGAFNASQSSFAFVDPVFQIDAGANSNLYQILFRDGVGKSIVVTGARSRQADAVARHRSEFVITLCGMPGAAGRNTFQAGE